MSKSKDNRVNLGTHICDKVDARYLLHHLSTHTQKSSGKETLRAILEEQLERPFG
jgi:hypothetical protein